MWVIKYRKIWFALSGVLMALSIIGMFKFGFNLSIDFKGGAITEVKYAGEVMEKSEVESKIKELDLGGFSVRPSESDRYIIRTRELSQKEVEALVEAIGSPAIERSNSIGPTAGSELRSKSIKAIAVVVIMIVLFITFAFRKVSPPRVGEQRESRRESLPHSWKYGFATIIALMHDVVIPTGIFVFLGFLFGHEIDLLFVTGLLAILGYSVHDTIVVFDRVRENLRLNYEKNQKEEFDITVGKSVQQTFGRSINTSLTIFITLLALFIFGSTATKDFSLLLLVGVVIGTYSSIFVASPLLVTFQKLQKQK